MKWFRRKKNNRRVTAEEPVASRWPRRFSIAMLMLVVGTAGTALSLYLRDLEVERFETLEISGELDRVNAQEVHAVLKPFVVAGFAGIDIRGAQQALEALPWVADAAVRRQWPGTLVVELREEKPVATWFGTALMNARGHVFIDGAAGFSVVLADVVGPAGSQADLIARGDDVRGLAE
ncbi:MAG: FtsQ-type POTRA domain-containing protein [Proteobacteria bacterium]|nr:FtsQ-type POTRA domain-containing protein [Pseudomonadota bacterium]